MSNDPGGVEADVGVTILGVHVPAYKNLRSVWVPWSDGLVLLGANGAGKTNLLEVIALILGNNDTLVRGLHRFDFSVSGVSVVVAGDHERMPLAPHATKRINYPDVWEGGLAEQIVADDKWWRDCSPDQFAVTPDWRAATVRYTLEAIGPSLTDNARFERRFKRTLLKVGAGKTGPPSAGEAVLQLPDATVPPAELNWLPRLRTTAEADDDLIRAFDEAQVQLARLVVTVNDSLEVLPDELGSEAGWLLHEIAALAANEELSITTKRLSIQSLADGDAHWSVAVEGESGIFEIGHTGSTHLLERLSSGQQRWADEAFATMSGAMRRYGLRAGVFADIAHRVSEDEWQRARDDLAPAIERVRGDKYWSFNNFSTILQQLEPTLLMAAKSDEGNDRRVQRILRAFSPQLDVLRPKCSVRLFDEPEAHLHPGEQRRIARAIDKLRLRGDNVILASHSATFLDVAGWKPLRVKAGSVEEVDDLDAPARTAVARDLGATRGELLAGISALLVVEGEHDQLVLDRCFGVQLRAAGVVILPMRGTENLPSVLALDFIQRYMDVPPTIMVDFTVAARVRNGSGKTQEERKLVELAKQAERLGFAYTVIGLSLPDIVCYLSDDAVAEIHHGFPGWNIIVQKFHRLRPRPRFKDWLAEDHGVELRSSGHIKQVLDIMSQRQLQPGGQLVREVNELLARIDE